MWLEIRYSNLKVNTEIVYVKQYSLRPTDILDMSYISDITLLNVWTRNISCWPSKIHERLEQKGLQGVNRRALGHQYES